MSFMFALPRISLSGKNAMSDVVEWLAQKNTRNVLLLTDPILRKLDGLQTLLSQLKAKQIACTIYDAIDPNPTVDLPLYF